MYRSRLHVPFECDQCVHTQFLNSNLNYLRFQNSIRLVIFKFEKFVDNFALELFCVH